VLSSICAGHNIVLLKLVVSKRDCYMCVYIGRAYMQCAMSHCLELRLMEGASCAITLYAGQHFSEVALSMCTMTSIDVSAELLQSKEQPG